MKWMQQNSQRACARQPLTELLHDRLDAKESQRLATHLDECETCQQRLTALAADSQWWLNAGRWLDPAAGGMDCDSEASECDSSYDADSHYPDAEQDLLATGLLDASEKTGVIGTLGRYEVHCVIGAGGTGIVLKAIDLELNRTVAIKVLSPVLAASGAARRRFAREGQAVAAVAHENVVAVHHVEGAGRLPFLVMQYIDGDSLQDLIVRDGPLDATTALRMTAQVASALSAAHDQGLVHRDVKPANILVGAAGQRVWITDFGLARAVDDASLTRTGFIAGTPHYMSPEQARGEAVRASSDLFGLGSVLYFVLTGRPPFRADRTLAVLTRICNEPHRPVREVNPDVPPVLAELVDRLLHKSAADRFADADAVRTRCLQLLAASTAPDGDVERTEVEGQPIACVLAPAEPGNRRSRLRRLSFAVMFLILVGLGVAVDSYFRRDRPTEVDPPETVEDLAITDGEPIPMPRVNEPVSLADTAVADRNNGSFTSETDEGFEAVAANDEASSDPLPFSASPLSVIEWSATPLSEGAPSATLGAPSATFDSSTVSPAMAASELTPRPVQAEPSESAASTEVAVDEESSMWAIQLDELRASLRRFETQIEQPPRGELFNGGITPTTVCDSFRGELSRMEDALRTLESVPVRDGE